MAKAMLVAKVEEELE
jgi:hypothetical protein